MAAIINDRDKILSIMSPRSILDTSTISITVSNPVIVVSANSSGLPTSYSNSGTTINVYKSGVPLNYGTLANTFNISSTVSPSGGVTIGTGTGTGGTYSLTDITYMSTILDAVKVTYTVTVLDTDSTQYTFYTSQVFNKVKNGSAGSSGSAGARGSLDLYITGSGPISSAKCNAAVLAQTGYATLVLGDQVTESNGTYVGVLRWDGSTWAVPGIVIDGSLIVTGSITAAKINTTGLEIRDNSGNLIFGANTPLTTARISGLGALATQSSVSTGQVSGLGALATQSSVSTGQVTGLGAVATLNTIPGTYIENLSVNKLTAGTINTSDDRFATSIGTSVFLDGYGTSYYCGQVIKRLNVGGVPGPAVVINDVANNTNVYAMAAYSQYGPVAKFQAGTGTFGTNAVGITGSAYNGLEVIGSWSNTGISVTNNTGGSALKVVGISSFSSNVSINGDFLTYGSSYMAGALQVVGLITGTSTKSNTTRLLTYEGGGAGIYSTTVGSAWSSVVTVANYNFSGSSPNDMAYAPRLAWHWSNKVASSLSLDWGGRFCFNDNPGTGYANIIGNTIYASGSFVQGTSDRRLKTDIRPITSAIAKVKSLNGFIHKWNTLAGSFGFDVEEDIVGLFAQEVQLVLPEAIKQAPFDGDGFGGSKSKENYITVQYEKLVPLLVEAIKEQQIRIETMEAEVALLKG